MNKDAVDKIYSALSQTGDPVGRSKIFDLVRTRVVSGLEKSRNRDEADKYWNDINKDLEAIINGDPQEAFQFAVDTLQLNQPSEGPDQYRSWLKGNALVILSHPNVRSLLIADLNKSDGSVIRSSLNSFLDYQIPQAVQTIDDLSDHPQCFNLVMSLVIIHGLHGQKLQSISPLEHRSQDLLQDEHVKQVIGFYYNTPGDTEFVRPIYQAVQNSK